MSKSLPAPCRFDSASGGAALLALMVVVLVLLVVMDVVDVLDVVALGLAVYLLRWWWC